MLTNEVLRKLSLSKSVLFKVLQVFVAVILQVQGREENKQCGSWLVIACPGYLGKRISAVGAQGAFPSRACSLFLFCGRGRAW